jgi:acyl transferase domain-containing protein
VIAQALEQSGVDPNAISYIDGHGTGTSLGDPIEIEGLGKALRARDNGRRIAIGSVKSNIGHLEAAAGIASVVKVMLQMEHGQLVPSLHSEQLNPNINLENSLFEVQRDSRHGRLPRTARVAGVAPSAGGSNAHDPRGGAGPQAPLAEGNGPAVFVFSALGGRLKEMVRRFETYLRDANRPTSTSRTRCSSGVRRCASVWPSWRAASTSYARR